MVCTTHFWENLGMVDPISLQKLLLDSWGIQVCKLLYFRNEVAAVKLGEVERVQLVGRNEMK